MIERMSGAGSWAELRAVAARRARARNRRIEAERASTGWPVFAPQTGLAEGPLGVAQAADREIARQFALRARALAAFAADRPASGDRAPGEPGAMSAERWAARPEVLRPVSEWAAQEVSIGLTCSQGRANTLLAEAVTLAGRLPGTLAALEGGLLTVDHRFCLLEHVAPIGDARLRAEVEAEVLRWVAARAGNKTITTPAQLGDKVLRVVTRRNARDRTREALQALRERGVFRQRERAEGLAGLGVVASEPEIAALHAALAACVDALPRDPADGRTREQKMLDVLLDLVLRPGEGTHPPVQVLLTLVASLQTALGGDQPAELNGRVVSAETARQLLNALTGAGLGEGALAELRRLADPEAPDAQAPDAQAPDAQAPDAQAPDPEAADPEAPDTDESPDGGWERRLAAGEFDDPDPMPEEVWAASVAARLASGEIDLELDRDLAEAQDRWWAEFEAGLHPDPDPDPPDDRSNSPTQPPPSAPPNRAPQADGWWAAADRAVADATVAQGEAEAALTRAGRLVRTAAQADACDETAWRRGSGGRVDAAEDAMTALCAASVADRAALGELLARGAGGGLAERPRIALVEALSGALVSLTDLPGLRRAARDGVGLGAPPPTGGYRPGAALDRYIRTRDRRCRFPGCRRPVARGEIDHRIAWPAGPTNAANLAGFCTSHHRGKHQAPGFGYDLAPNGTLVVTTPSGLVATTEPPPY